MARVLNLLVVVLPVAAALAEQRISGDWTYTIDEAGAATIASYTGDEVEVTVPTELDGIPVKHIGDMVFFSCGPRGEKPFTKITIPEGIESLGGSLCVSAAITEIAFPASLRGIGDRAFTGTGLTNVLIPAGVTHIGQGAFGYCENLTGFSVDSENRSYSSIDGVLFDKDGKKLLQYPLGKPAEFTISDGVTAIAAMAFTGAKSLTHVELPSSVKNIGEHAFQDTGLTAITLPKGLESIDNSAFLRCRNLTVINVPSTVTSIGEGALSSCGKMPEISVDPANPNYMSVDGVLFDKDRKTLLQFPGGKTGHYVIPEGTTTIAPRAFEGVVATSVTVPSSVTSIGANAFRWATNLTKVMLPESLMAAIESYGLPKELFAKLENGDVGKTDQVVSPASTLKVGEITYENVTLKGEYPRSLYIQHDGGTAFIERSALSEEQLTALLGSGVN